MEEKIITDGATQLLNYGVLGLFCIFLIALLYFFWRHMNAREKNFTSQITTRDELHLEQMTKREEVHDKQIEKFTDVMQEHAKNEAQQTEVMRDLKGLIHGHIFKDGV